MPDVIMKLSGEEGALVRSLLNVVDAQKHVEGGLRSIKKESSEVTKYFKDFEAEARNVGQSIAQNINPNILAMGTAGGALSVAWDTFTASVEKSRERAKELRAEIDKMWQAAAMMGKIDIMKDISDKIDAIKSPTVGKDQRRALWADVASNFGTRLDTDQQAQAVQFGVRAREGGGDAHAAMMTFGMLRESFKNASLEDVNKAAGQLLHSKYAAPDESEERQSKRFAAQGKTLDQVMPFFFAQRKGGENAKSAQRLFDEADSEISPDVLQDKKIKDPAVTAEISKLREQNLKLERAKLDLQEKGTAALNLPAGLGEHTKEKALNEELGKREKEIRLNSLRIQELEHAPEILAPASGDELRKRELYMHAPEDRVDLMIQNPSLAPQKLRGAAANLAQGINEFRTNPPPSIVEKDRTDTFNATDPMLQARINADAADKALADKQADKRKLSDLQTQTRKTEMEVEYSPAVAKYGGFMLELQEFMLRMTGLQQPGANAPLQVEIIGDRTKDNVPVAGNRNAGNGDDAADAAANW